MKIVFLDIDGVLNTSKTIWLAEKKFELRGRVIGFNRLDPETIDHLNRVTDATGAKIVISSSWRIGCRTAPLFEILCAYLHSQGVKAEIIGRTPIDLEYKDKVGTAYISVPRGQEIQMWLDKNPGVESFVIVDDNSDMEHLTPKLVQTQFEVGITKTDADKMIEVLKGITW